MPVNEWQRYWIWYTALPLATHLALLVAAALLWRNAASSLYVIAAAAMAFVLSGVHNSWDTVTYVAMKHSQSMLLCLNNK